MRLLLTGLLFGAMLAPAAALADPFTSAPKDGASKATAAKVARPAKATSVKPAGQVQAADATVSEPLNPRWISKSWKISGLTVWTFTPGHFQGQ